MVGAQPATPLGPIIIGTVAAKTRPVYYWGFLLNELDLVLVGLEPVHYFRK